MRAPEDLTLTYEGVPLASFHLLFQKTDTPIAGHFCINVIPLQGHIIGEKKTGIAQLTRQRVRGETSAL